MNNKEKYREYLNKVFQYVNVWSICSLYNEQYPEKKIDYNNLKSFVNKKMYEKISEKRLENLIFFIKQNVAISLILEDNKEKHIAERSKKELKKDIIDMIKKYEGA